MIPTARVPPGGAASLKGAFDRASGGIRGIPPPQNHNSRLIAMHLVMASMRSSTAPASAQAHGAACPISRPQSIVLGSRDAPSRCGLEPNAAAERSPSTWVAHLLGMLGDGGRSGRRENDASIMAGSASRPPWPALAQGLQRTRFDNGIRQPAGFPACTTALIAAVGAHRRRWDHTGERAGYGQIGP